MSRHSTKGISPIISVLLLLVVAVIAAIGVTRWYMSSQTFFATDIDAESQIGDLEILGLRNVDDRFSILGVRNLGEVEQTISKYMIDGNECSAVRDSVVGDVTLILLNCSVNNFESYNVEIFSNAGVFSKVTTVLEEAQGLFGFYYRYSGEPCDVGDVKIYGLYYTTGSSAEIASENNFPVSLCGYHSLSTLTNTCSGDFERLFYLGNVTNSHVYTVTTSARAAGLGYYTWTPVCIGSTDALSVDIYFGNTPPSQDYSCAGSFEVDDVLGAHIGDCDYYPANGIWISVPGNTSG